MVLYSEEQIFNLEEISRKLRIRSLEMIYKRGAGHPGGSLSAADIIASLYFYKMKIDPGNPFMENRDRFILSKGHASAVLYAALAMKGYFPEDDLDNWGQLSCHLQGHPDRNKTPGVDMNTGTLGHGINIAAGMLLGGRLKKINFKVYVLLGDGECQGGIIWEGAMTAAKYKLGNLVAILDYNRVQLDGFVKDIMPLEPIVEKWKSFNFEVFQIDGHNIRQILEALDGADNIHGKPVMIIAKTVKGKGVSFMENNCYWHGTAPNKDQLETAKKELLERNKK
ncbi:MAG: transketolase [Actinobacteria bacterium]|nr:transketolase [Actinomycetota bacterium]